MKISGRDNLLGEPLDTFDELEILKTQLIGNYDKFPRENTGNIDAIVNWDGYRRLSMMEDIVIKTIQNRIDGDFVEAGVYRGGVTILMTALLKKLNVSANVINYDSFCGIPYNYDKSSLPIGLPTTATKKFDTNFGGKLKCKLHKVKRNFEKFNMLHDNVIFVEGFFKDTLPITTVNRISVLRVDCDLYQSTFEVLFYLYPKLSVGGCVVFDDYKFDCCAKAIKDYRTQFNITTTCRLGCTLDPILYWIKSDITG